MLVLRNAYFQINFVNLIDIHKKHNRSLKVMVQGPDHYGPPLIHAVKRHLVKMFR
jgi:hypothetical protein